MAKFAPLITSTENLPTRIAERLRAQIIGGVLSPGERLPPERELATSLNVSRSALREATRVLESVGVLNIQHGRGTFVAHSDPHGSLAAALRPTSSGVVAPRELWDLCQVRRIVEPESAALAAATIKSRELARLRNLCEHADAVLAKTPSDLETISRYNYELHAGIARASGNLVLARIVEDMMRLLTEIRRYSMRRPGRARASWCEHRRIVEALGDRDAKAVRRLMQAHIDRAAHASLPRRMKDEL